VTCIRLSLEAASTVINRSVLSRVCYSHLAGEPHYAYVFDRLQSVLNAAAELLRGFRKYNYVTLRRCSEIDLDFIGCLFHTSDLQTLPTYLYTTLHDNVPRYIITLCLPQGAGQHQLCQSTLSRSFPGHVLSSMTLPSLLCLRTLNTLLLFSRSSCSIEIFKRWLNRNLFSIA